MFGKDRRQGGLMAGRDRKARPRTQIEGYKDQADLMLRRRGPTRRGSRLLRLLMQELEDLTKRPLKRAEQRISGDVKQLSNTNSQGKRQ